jgi:hypothetical protein
MAGHSRSKNGVASLAHSRSKNGVASLAHSRSKNGVASLAYSRSKNGVASLAYVSRPSRLGKHRASLVGMPGTRPGMTVPVVRPDQITL